MLNVHVLARDVFTGANYNIVYYEKQYDVRTVIQCFRPGIRDDAKVQRCREQAGSLHYVPDRQRRREFRPTQEPHSAHADLDFHAN